MIIKKKLRDVTPSEYREWEKKQKEKILRGNVENE